MPEQTTLPAKKTNGTLAHWDPFEMFDTLQAEMDRFWQWPRPFWSAGVPAIFGRAAGPAPAWAPRTDVFERDNYLVVKAELPGLKNEDVQLELDNGTLVIHGETKAESEVKEEKYYRMERGVGSFYRRMPLPFDVTADQIQATMKDGVLEVRIPKNPVKPETQKVPIS
jgi:HSP20 family protein